MGKIPPKKGSTSKYLWTWVYLMVMLHHVLNALHSEKKDVKSVDTLSESTRKPGHAWVLLRVKMESTAFHFILMSVRSFKAETGQIRFQPFTRVNESASTEHAELGYLYSSAKRTAWHSHITNELASSTQRSVDINRTADWKSADKAQATHYCSSLPHAFDIKYKPLTPVQTTVHKSTATTRVTQANHCYCST